MTNRRHALMHSIPALVPFVSGLGWQGPRMCCCELGGPPCYCIALYQSPSMRCALAPAPSPAPTHIDTHTHTHTGTHRHTQTHTHTHSHTHTHTHTLTHTLTHTHT